MKFRQNLKFSTSGIRGVVGESLTPRLTAALAAAFGRYVGGGRVLIGRDTRPSGEMFEHSVVAGLLSVGCQPVLLGVIPTPTVQLMVAEAGANGGIAITASHNPGQWNALKLIGSKGTFLDEVEAGELFDVYNQNDFNPCHESELRSIRHISDAFSIHCKRIFANIDVEAIRKHHFKVAVDCCNGVGAVYSRKFLEDLGCEVYTIHDQPNGIFERIPEPLPENLGALSKLVREKKCHIGFAQDPDGDRLSLVDDLGTALPTHYSLLMTADHVLSENPGTMVVNIQTSMNLEEIASTYGCEVVYAKVGEINVVQKMIEVDAELGGEGNCGGVIWRRVTPGRDSFVTMALLLEMLAMCNERVSDIAADLDHYVSSSVKFACPPFTAREIVRIMTTRYSGKRLMTIDGLRVNYNDGWILIRPSNTEPVLRLTAETLSDERTGELLQRFQKEIKELLEEFNKTTKP